MSKLFKVGGILIGVGILTIVGTGIASGDWNGLYASVNRYTEVDPYVATGEVHTIEIDTNNRRIILSPTTEATVTIAYYESEFDHIDIEEINQVLSITNPMDWQANFVFSFNLLTLSQERTIYVGVPVTGQYSIDIYTKNGAINVSNMDNIHTIDASTLNGSIYFNQVKDLTSLDANSANGTISVLGTTVTGKMDVSTSNGSIHIGNDSSASSVYATTSNGTIDVSETIADDYDLVSSNGSVELTAYGLVEDYYITLHTNLGSTYLNGSKTSTRTYGNSSLPKRINMKTSNGDVRLTVANV